jgi:hypothetical protein
VLENARHERFAQLVSEGASQSDAYVEAGYHPGTEISKTACSSKLACKPKIKARILELQELGQRRAERKLALKRTDILQMLIDDRDAARKKGQLGPAVRATELLGRTMGLFIDKAEIKTNALDDIDIGQLDELSEKLIAESARRIAITDRDQEEGTEEGQPLS